VLARPGAALLVDDVQPLEQQATVRLREPDHVADGCARIGTTFGERTCHAKEPSAPPERALGRRGMRTGDGALRSAQSLRAELGRDPTIAHAKPSTDASGCAG
jgi:hypothetical protein